MYRDDKMAWIPDKTVETKQQIVVEAHCGECGRRPYEATLGIIQTT